MIVQGIMVSSNHDKVLMMVVNLLLVFVEFICLWCGLIIGKQKANVMIKVKGAGALIIWYIIMCLLGLINYSGVIVFVAMAAWYVFIIRNLYKLAKEFDKVGYVIYHTANKMNDRLFMILLGLLLIVGFACSYVFGDRYPMKWSKLDTAIYTELEDTKAYIISLGFPSQILNDISTTDIASCNGALKVVVNGSKSVGDSKSKVKDLHITSIGVQIPGD